MKTNEVIKEIEYMDLQAEIRDNYLYIFSGREQIASVNLIRKFEINTNYWAFKNLLAEDEREKVYVLLTRLAETDPQDREEEKRYYLKHRYLQSSFTNLNDFLSYSASDNKLALSNGINFPKYKTHFTLKEIEEIKEKFNTDLEDFEIIEVKDEN